MHRQNRAVLCRILRSNGRKVPSVSHNERKEGSENHQKEMYFQDLSDNDRNSCDTEGAFNEKLLNMIAITLK